MGRVLAAAILSLLVGIPALSQSGRVLFDASKHEQAGNADWIIDADAWNLNMPAFPCSGNTNESNPGRYPTPPQSGITPATSDNYWTGGISAWAVALAKAGHTIETLPNGAAITYGNGSNPQDLSNYDLFIVPEPQNLFTPAEKAAILAFVNAGGGLFMVADHETSDRDCDGFDSPMVYNDLTGATGTANTGIFGIWFRVDGLQVKGEDWFDDGIDNNVTTDPADPIIHGPFGDGSGGLGFFGATSMDINPADNPSVTAHVWRTGQPHNNLRVTFATASYGAGRVAAIGDSSPADDNTGDPGDTLYAGWDLAAGGVKNKEIHLNACHWLLNPAPDTTPPQITAGPTAAPADCTAGITWTTDELSTSVVQFGTTVAYGSTASTSGNVTSHSVTLSGLTPATTYHYRAGSTDGSGNGPSWSADSTFTTAAATPPSLTAGPAASGVSGSSATIAWATSEAASSTVYYGLTAAYGNTVSTAGFATDHTVPLAGLTPETLYHYQVSSTDACGNGPVVSSDATFTTGPASLDISGWTLKQFNSTQTFTFPPGTTIPSGGYLVLGRDAARTQFEALFPAMPAATVYVDSNANGSCSAGCFPMINGAETFELWNGATRVDGTTIAMAANNAYQRKNPGDPAGNSASWTTVPMASANPGQGVGAATGAGVVIHEMADAVDYANEFIELYYDAGASNPVLAAPTATPATRCAGATTQLTANPSGGTPPYTYLWSPPTGLDSATTANPVSSSAATTTYTVVVTDSLSASSSASPVTVTVSVPAASPTAVPSTILPGATSQLAAGVAGGAAPYTFAWTPTAGLNDSSIATPVASPASTTLYSVVATDALGCASAPQGVTVTVVQEVSGPGASQVLQLSRPASGSLTFRFGWAGPGMTYHLYAVASESAMDAGTWAGKWCDLANNPAGTWATDAATWASWTSASPGSFPDGNFVVVAENGGIEGSYGQKSGGGERGHDSDKAALAGLCPTTAPSCGVTSPSGGTTGGIVTVGFSVTDPDSPLITASFAYSTDGGTSWLACTAAAGSSNPASVAPGSRTFGWASGTDLPANAAVLLRVSLHDGWSTSQCSSVGFAVDNRPSCAITSPTSGAQSGTISVTYNANDRDDASLTAAFAYSTNGGSSWSPATAASGTNPAPITPGTGRTFSWASATDIPGNSAAVFRVTLGDATSQSSCTSSFTVANAPTTCAGHVVIGEFRTRGSGLGLDEFVELYNPTAATVNIGGWKLRSSSNTGAVSDRATIPANTLLGPGQHYLFAYTPGYSGTTTPDQTYTTTGIADNGGLAITWADNTIVDQVGMSAGSAFKEGTPLAPTGSSINQSYERKPGGSSGNGSDTDNNTSDFIYLSGSAPNPQNLSSPTVPCM